MKNLLLTLALIGFVGCSSAKKEETKEMVEQDTQAAQTEAEQAVDNAKEDVEAAADEMANEEEDAATATKDESGMTGDFGPYEGTEKSKVSCTSGTSEEDVRTVAVLDGTNGGCGVVYNKFGNDKTVAVAQYNMEFCPEVQSKIKANLETAGFTCK